MSDSGSMYIVLFVLGSEDNVLKILFKDVGFIFHSVTLLIFCICKVFSFMRSLWVLILILVHCALYICDFATVHTQGPSCFICDYKIVKLLNFVNPEVLAKCYNNTWFQIWLDESLLFLESKVDVWEHVCFYHVLSQKS